MDYLKALQDRTRPDLWALITRLADLAANRASPLYIVGGRVRDLLLERPATDLDLVVEGDALELVRALALDQGGEAVVHPRFGTATYRNGTLRFDLATARTETYSRPGVLPDVRPGPIEEDLARRDFTVNAMALRLSPPDAGTLLDRFGSRQDVEEGLIRVLHDGSFVDDPTRIMRAIRYEQRLGFQIEPSTLAPPIEGPPPAPIRRCGPPAPRARSLSSGIKTRAAPPTRRIPRRSPDHRSRIATRRPPLGDFSVRPWSIGAGRACYISRTAPLLTRNWCGHAIP